MGPVVVTYDPGEWVIDGLIRALAHDPAAAKTHRLYQQLRDWIQAAELAEDTRLPSSRTLARRIGVGRNTVLAAIDQLIAEGFLTARVGAGVFVADAVLAGEAGALPCQRSPRLSLSHRGQSLLALAKPEQPMAAAFVPGVPALDRFPWQIWRQTLQRHHRRVEAQTLKYRSDGGHPALRAAIADYVRLSRGVVCDAEQILITRGAQHAFDLIARLMTDAGDVAWVEEPGYLGVTAAWRAADLVLAPLPVDEQGADVSCIDSGTAPPKLIYVTPSHQYPLGCTLSMMRRKALIDAARRYGAWIVEDDYDSEFRYDAQPLSSLQGMAGGDPVLYVGTFSKTMYPGLQIGFVVLPWSAVDTFRLANARVFREGDYLTQAALADFMNAGHFARHVGRMRRCYAHRRSTLISILHTATCNGLSLSGAQAGLHMLARVATRTAEDRLVDRLRAQDVFLQPLSDYYLSEHKSFGLVLGYGNASIQQIECASLLLIDALIQI